MNAYFVKIACLGLCVGLALQLGVFAMSSQKSFLRRRPAVRAS